MERNLGQELVASAGGRIIGRSGGMGADGSVDPYSHFINVYMLDRNGNRIDRRNPQISSSLSTTSKFPPGRVRLSILPWKFCAAKSARSRSRPGSIIASSTVLTSTLSTARGKDRIYPSS